VKICCVSDLHGHLPDIPDADLLLIGGDIVPLRHNFKMCRDWFDGKFRDWLTPISARMSVVAVAGNHDFIFQHAPEMVPELPWIYLQDSGTEVGGYKVWGSPWQRWWGGWAFNLQEPELCEKWALIPDGIDILLLHSPPYGHCDLSFDRHQNLGSPGLARRIKEVDPLLAVFGHIHVGYGTSVDEQGTVYINAAQVDWHYEPVNPPIMFELEEAGVVNDA
jgi:Icc-related predicted phosphoesterase